MQGKITLSIDSELLREAKALAKQTGVSLNDLLITELEQIVADRRAYNQARESGLERLKKGLERKFSTGSRDELHER